MVFRQPPSDHDSPRKKRAPSKSSTSKVSLGAVEGKKKPLRAQKNPPPPKKKRSKKSSKKVHKKTSRRIIGFLGRWCLMLGAWGILLGGLGLLWFSYDLPHLEVLSQSHRKPSVLIQSQEGHVIGTFGDLYEEALSIEDIPDHVWQAFVAIEDRRFFSHFGLDVIGLLRAAYENYTAGRVVQGGSSITQQVAKNFLQSQKLYDYRDKSLRRKVQEALMSLWLEAHFTKKQILAMYINRTYFGSGAYGVDAAAHTFFGKSARELIPEESAIIAGLLKAPSRYSPRANPKQAKIRGKVVMREMYEAGFIPSMPENFDHVTFVSEEYRSGAQYFCEWIMDGLPDYIGTIDRDLIVVTTLHASLQEEAEKACKSVMEEQGAKYKATQCGLLSLAHDGGVKAMVGGLDYYRNQYNRAVTAYRQSGSIFKIFVYLAALEEGYDPEMMIEDSKFKIGDWEPNLYYWKAQGQVPLRWGFVKSINTVTVRVAQMVGPKKIALMAKRLGITTDMTYDLSMALGSKEVNLLDMGAAMTSFINGYHSVWPYGIVEIRDKSTGRILYQYSPTARPKVLSDSVGGTMKAMLKQVIEEGTGYNARVKGIDCFGKTGSNGDLDAWFAGFREGSVAKERLSAVVWVGNDHNAPMSKRSTGSRLPSFIWHRFIKNTDKILKGSESQYASPVPHNESKTGIENIVLGEDKNSPDSEESINDLDHLITETSE
jgi:penicillin-binding protein 1A